MTRRTMKRTIHGLAAMILVAAAAAAQPPGGPGETWQRFADRFDADGDGTITREEYDQEEYDRQASRFLRLDHDDDGVLTEADFEGRMRGRLGAGIVRPADADGDGAVSTREWADFLAAADPDGDGAVEMSDLIALFHQGRPQVGPPRGMAPGSRPDGAEPGRGPVRLLDRDGDGVLEAEDLNAIFVELDADGDGALSSEEVPPFPGPPGRRGRRGPGGFGGGRTGG